MDISNYMPPLVIHPHGIAILEDAHRRLQSTPAWGDFIVVISLGGFFYFLLKVLMNISNSWKRMMEERVQRALQKRKNVKDPFRAENGYSWDYVLIFKVNSNDFEPSMMQKRYSMKNILNTLADGGLQTKLFYNFHCDHVYCKIRAPLSRLLKEADRVGYRLPLDPATVSTYLREGKRRPEKPDEWLWKSVEIPESSIETNIPPYDFLYAEFDDRPEINFIYKRWSNNTIFRGVDRLKLIAGILSARRSDGGCFLKIYDLITDGCLVQFFPLHDIVELRALESKWLRFCQLPWLQHVDDVKNYFGEKVGLYFVFLGHFTTWGISASVVGFICWIAIAAANNNPNSPLMPYFCAFMAVWSTLFLEYWKRKEKTKAMEWGMVGYEDEEQVRPQFRGEAVPNPIDGKEYLYTSRSEAARRLVVSSSIVFGLILVVIGVVAGIFFVRIILNRTSALTVGGIQLGGIIASIANSVQIQVMNMIYGGIAIWLTDFENHRTDTDYEDALTAKTFVFQFVNSYASLFYIAFVKPYIQNFDHCTDSCMKELQTTLGTIFLVRLAVGNITEIGVPAVKAHFLKKKERDYLDDISEIEQTNALEDYNVMLGTFEDYAELIILYGYGTMFIAAFPLATVLSLLSNYIEIRIDAWKLCQQCKRPEPRSAEDIGTWYLILEVMSTISVLTNAALVAFTSSELFNYPLHYRVWMFLIMSGCIFTVTFVIGASVPDVPREVEIQLKRQEYVISKVIFDAMDEEEVDFSKEGKAAATKALSTEYTIRITDDDPL